MKKIIFAIVMSVAIAVFFVGCNINAEENIPSVSDDISQTSSITSDDASGASDSFVDGSSSASSESSSGGSSDGGASVSSDSSSGGSSDGGAPASSDSSSEQGQSSSYKEVTPISDGGEYNFD